MFNIQNRLSISTNVGVAVGVDVGVAVGVDVGLAVRVAVGDAVGVAVGLAVGVAVGAAVGAAVGTTQLMPVRQTISSLQHADSEPKVLRAASQQHVSAVSRSSQMAYGFV